MSVPPEADLRRLYDRAPVGFYRSTADGRFLYANPALIRMLGYDSLEQVLALDLARDVYVDPGVRPRLVVEHLARGTVDGVAVRWRTRSGRPLIVRLYGYAVADDAGGPGFEVTAVDVTAQHAAEAEAATQRALAARHGTALDMLVDQVPAIIAIIDRELRHTAARGSGLRELGYVPADLIGRSMLDFVGEDDVALAHTRAALAGHVGLFEYETAGRQLAVSVAPMREGDAIVGAISIAVDVTESRRFEARIAAAQKAESLGVLAGGVAHDFNNLLVAILGNADLALLDLAPGTDARVAVDAIRTAALRAAELTDQLLAVAGRRTSAATRIELRPIVDELLVLLRPTFRPELTVEVAIASDALAVKADPTQLRQVLLNLFANAREAVGRGRIAVRTRAVHADGAPHDDDALTPPAGDHVMIEVSDDGPGMDAAIRRRVFEPFFTTKPHGHGLGLAAVLGIVRAHGGGIRLASVLGAGTTFQVFWPAATPLRALGARVLVVDDEAMVRDVVCRMLDDVGYATTSAPDGATALARVRAGEPIDVVILDLSMPGMSGREVLHALRAEQPALPVIVCSGQDRDRADAADAAGFLSKPFHFDELIAALEGALAARAR